MLKHFGVPCAFLVACVFGIGSALADQGAVLCVQRQLNALGFDAGKADGGFGAQTRQAGERYHKFMSTKSLGWASPPLSAGNAEDWCKHVASAHAKAVKFYKDYVAESGGSIVLLTTFKVPKAIKAGAPYLVELGYKIEGKAPINIDEACFTWNNEGPYCFPAEVNQRKRTVRLTLTTGNPNHYRLNGAIRYSSGAKSILSNWYTHEIDVK